MLKKYLFWSNTTQQILEIKKYFETKKYFYYVSYEWEQLINLFSYFYLMDSSRKNIFYLFVLSSFENPHDKVVGLVVVFCFEIPHGKLGELFMSFWFVEFIVEFVWQFNVIIWMNFHCLKLQRYLLNCSCCFDLMKTMILCLD